MSFIVFLISSRLLQANTKIFKFIKMSLYSGFSTKNQESFYDNLCISLITNLSQRVLKALRHEPCDDAQFSRTITSIYQKLVETELQKFLPPKASECISDLAAYCKKNNTHRAYSNESEMTRKFTPEKSGTSKTPNLSFLDKIIEESPKLQRSGRKTVNKRRIQGKPETSNHPYYEIMMGKYLKMALKSPMRNSMTTTRAKQQPNQVQLTDGMFFRLF